ncbi:MAG: AAA family ATPase [Planctomycetia bacterium]|nr:AAA family ATPase [Planctomycetia bacterium]
MKISRIKVDGFGVWRDLDIDGLSGQATVFYGPNEAGKTTLMQFVRSLLYGFSPQRRERYLPPVRGGVPGGTLTVENARGRFEVARRADRGRATGEVVVTTPDGMQQGESALNALLAGVDEAIYNNVYACGLREMQELGTLSDTDAAEHLYELTTGLDRVSLADVERALVASRERLLAPDGRPTAISRLLAERTRLNTAIEAVRGSLARYARLTADVAGLEQSVVTAERQHDAAEQEARNAELALGMRDKWLQWSELNVQWAALTPSHEIPDRAIERLDLLNSRITAWQEKRVAEQNRHRGVRDQAQALAVNEGLWRQSARIEALVSQREWILSLVSQIAAAEAEEQELMAKGSGLRGRLGFGSDATARQGSPRREFKSLRGPARELMSARAQMREAREAVAAAEAEHKTAEKELAGRSNTLGAKDLSAAMEERGALAGQLRRRMQLEERRMQARREQTELEEESQQLLERQLLPFSVLIGLGGVFVVGTLLVLVGLFMPASIVGKFGWGLAILGAIGTGGAAAAKFWLERTAAQKLEDCESQLELLAQQQKDAEEEQAELDRKLPRGGGPLTSRLQSTEAELAALEDTLPLDARRQQAAREAQSAVTRAVDLKEKYRTARRTWQKALRAAGLPLELTPQQVRHLTASGTELDAVEQKVVSQRDVAEQRRRELAATAQRAVQLATDAKINIQGLSTLAIVDRLAVLLTEQEELVRRRDELHEAARQARAAAVRCGRRVIRLRRRRRALLVAAGVDSQEELRRLALSQARFEVISRQRESLAAELSTTARGLADDRHVFDLNWEHWLSELFAGQTLATLEQRLHDAKERASAATSRMQSLHVERGRLEEQIKLLIADRSAAELQLDLASVERQLRDAVARWQELAITGVVLDDIRIEFERERQPATLQEASGYLSQLTNGQYCRIWTPLGHRTLKVDNVAGESLRPEVLSEGTREQLFLSLRLALVAGFARRGISLPLVLDDVLVNFDMERTKSAIRVLRDFAREGHQLFLFTCHEHIARAFKTAKVELRTLPGRDAAFTAPPMLEIAEPQPLPAVETVEQPKPERRVRRPRREVVAPAIEHVAPPVIPTPEETRVKVFAAKAVPAKPERVEKIIPAKPASRLVEPAAKSRWLYRPYSETDEFYRIEFGEVTPRSDGEWYEVSSDHHGAAAAAEAEDAYGTVHRWKSRDTYTDRHEALGLVDEYAGDYGVEDHAVEGHLTESYPLAVEDHGAHDREIERIEYSLYEDGSDAAYEADDSDFHAERFELKEYRIEDFEDEAEAA